ncbi:MAG: class I SAM-dependent methyltransferase [Oscillospiraceae bacterium]|nr:class I SAM-dependent methyltransferase [Oscillospiraceae bacterium]
MYSSLFCRLYNEFGWNEYPRVLAGQLLQWLNQRGATVNTALDLGCGTGVLCETLHDNGIDTLGVDLSREMIAIARQRSPGLRYAVMDIVNLALTERFDLATCTGDAINHIRDLKDVGQVFCNVHAVLNPGGYFVFDLLNPDEVSPGEPFEVPYGEGGLVRFLMEDAGEGRITLNIEMSEKGRIKFSEVIHEKVHDVEAVCDLLRQNGLELLQCADRLLLNSDNHGTTWFIAAQKT